MRELIIVRIVHTPADMGSVSKDLKQIGMEKLGNKKWEENQARIKKFWDEVEKAIDKLKLDYNKVKIYQDGLPCTDQELIMKIIDKTAASGSKNYEIVKKLVEKGARIEGTESKDLLLEELKYIKAFVGAKSGLTKEYAKREYDKIKDELLKKRDEFIVGRIDRTLRDNETGILFIGAHHAVKSKLPMEIKIRSLD